MIFNVKDFGAIGDGYHDDSDAFQRALDSMTVSKAGLFKDAKGGGILLVPAGNYYMTKTLWISHRVEIIGVTGFEGENLVNYFFYDNPNGTCDSKDLPGAVSRLMFKRGVTGIRVASGGPLTNPGNNDVGYADAAAGTILRNLMIAGAFNRASSPEHMDRDRWLDTPVEPTDFAHGISVKARVIVENCYIYNFKGNGIHIVALTNGEKPPKNAIILNNAIGFDYSVFSFLRHTNHVGIKDGTSIGAQKIVVKDVELGDDDVTLRPIEPNIDLKHQSLGDLNRDNAYIIRAEDAAGPFNQLIRCAVNAIGSRFTDVVCAYNYLNGYYTIGNNAGNTLLERVDCFKNSGYGFFDSESSGANTYLNCQGSYNGKEGFYRLYTLLEGGKYGNKSLATHIYINCYQEGNGSPLGDPLNEKNLYARVYPHAIIIGGALSVSNNCEPDPDPAFNGFTAAAFGGGAKPAILTQAASNGFAGFPNGINALGGDNPNVAEVNKTKVSVDIGGIASGIALVFDQPLDSILHLMSVATVDDLVKEGDALVKEGKELIVVASIGADLHIRIFNVSNKQVIDMPEIRFLPGDALTNFKQMLTPFPALASLSSEQKQKIIRDAKLVSAYASPDASAVNVGYQPDINWWAMQNGKSTSTKQQSFLVSTDAAAEGANQFWLPNGFYIGDHPNRNKVISLNYDVAEDISKHRIGDIILNDNPVIDDPEQKRCFAGYICVEVKGEKKWAGFGKLELLE